MVDIEQIKKAWYAQGKIDGKREGLTDNEKYKQGLHDGREKAIKEVYELFKNVCFSSNTMTYVKVVGDFVEKYRDEYNGMGK